jgi:hypothetical protein
MMSSTDVLSPLTMLLPIKPAAPVYYDFHTFLNACKSRVQSSMLRKIALRRWPLPNFYLPMPPAARLAIGFSRHPQIHAGSQHGGQRSDHELSPAPVTSNTSRDRHIQSPCTHQKSHTFFAACEQNSIRSALHAIDAPSRAIPFSCPRFPTTCNSMRFGVIDTGILWRV